MRCACNGFPDTAYGFRKLAPLLVSRGWRVVAPFMRGYVPSSVPVDRSYHIGALMDDALRVRDACEPTDRDIVIGHDWGALTATGLAAMPDSPFTKAVVMSVPPPAALRAAQDAADAPGRLELLRLVGSTSSQLVRQLFQLPATGTLVVMDRAVPLAAMVARLQLHRPRRRPPPCGRRHQST